MSLLNKPLTISKHNVVKEAHLLAIFTTITSLVFWAFFAWSKTQQFAGVNPFAIDPYDAIGSFAFQIAVALSILSLARSFQQRNNTNSLQRLPFILRGIGVALSVTVITILGDCMAVAKQYAMVTSSIFGLYLLIGLGVVALFTLIDGLLFIKGLKHAHSLHETGTVSSSLGEVLQDVYVMVLSPLAKIFPNVEHAGQWLKKKVKAFEWISPYTHPWRFVLCVGIVLGSLISVAEFLKEGPPSHIQVAFLVMAIFIIGEVGATLLSFLMFGAFLGLRRPLFKKNPV
jgi:hypothetical protein